MLVDILHGRLNRRCRSFNEEEMLKHLVTEDGCNASAVVQNYTKDPTMVSPSCAQPPFLLDISESWPTTDLDRACGFDTQANHRCFSLVNGSANATLTDDLCLSIYDLTYVTPSLPAAAETTFIYMNDTFRFVALRVANAIVNTITDEFAARLLFTRSL